MADEPEEFDDDLDDDDDDEDGLEVGVTIEIVGLSLYTHHGVTAEERKVGQRILLDVRFDAGEPDALITDRVEDTIDYGEVCQVIALIAQSQSFRTLERLCAVIADRLSSQFGAESVTVKASPDATAVSVSTAAARTFADASPAIRGTCRVASAS